MSDSPNTSSDALATVLLTSSDAEASIVQALLRSHGLRAIITSDKLGALAALRGGHRPTVRVKVTAERVADARAIIEMARGADDDRGGAHDDARLEETLGYRFHDRGLLERALTHRSLVHEDPTDSVLDNESLEFLGDAVLGFVVADLLFREFPDRDEGEKSKMKASLRSNATLAKLGAVLRLGDFLLLGKGEAKSGGRAKHALVADAFEAVIAAIFLDGGIGPARAFIERQFAQMLGEFQQGSRPKGLADDHKSRLQEWLAAHSQPPPVYVVVGEDGPDHCKVFAVAGQVGQTVLAQAEGSSKKDAERGAAAGALERLESGGD